MKSPGKSANARNIFIIASVLVILFLIPGIPFFVKNAGILVPRPSPTTAPTPTAEPTKQWKTYENTKFGYSLKYPATWTADDKKPEKVKLNEPKPAGNSIIISIYPDSASMSPYEFMDKQFYKGYSGLESIKQTYMNGLIVKQITLNTLRAYRIDNIMLPRGPQGPGILISHENDAIFILADNPFEKTDKTFDQILQIFKFTQ